MVSVERTTADTVTWYGMVSVERTAVDTVTW